MEYCNLSGTGGTSVVSLNIVLKSGIVVTESRHLKLLQCQELKRFRMSHVALLRCQELE